MISFGLSSGLGELWYPRIIHDADDDVGTAEQDGKHEFAEYPSRLVRFADNSFLLVIVLAIPEYQYRKVLYSIQ